MESFKLSSYSGQFFPNISVENLSSLIRDALTLNTQTVSVLAGFSLLSLIVWNSYANYGKSPLPPGPAGLPLIGKTVAKNQLI